jgi:hypothetical protein
MGRLFLFLFYHLLDYPHSFETHPGSTRLPCTILGPEPDKVLAACVPHGGTSHRQVRRAGKSNPYLLMMIGIRVGAGFIQPVFSTLWSTLKVISAEKMS